MNGLDIVYFYHDSRLMLHPTHAHSENTTNRSYKKTKGLLKNDHSLKGLIIVCVLNYESANGKVPLMLFFGSRSESNTFIVVLIG